MRVFATLIFGLLFTINSAHALDDPAWCNGVGLSTHFTALDTKKVGDVLRGYALNPKKIKFTYFADKDTNGNFKIKIDLLYRDETIANIEGETGFDNSAWVDHVRINDEFKGKAVGRLLHFAMAELFFERGYLLTIDSQQMTRDEKEIWKVFNLLALTHKNQFVSAALKADPEIQSYYRFFTERARQVNR